MTSALAVAHGLVGGSLAVVSVLSVRPRSPEAMRRWTGILFPLLVAQTVLGDVLYPLYLASAKPVLLTLEAGSRSAADVFEVKEHLAFFALVLGAGAFAAARGSSPALTRLLLVACHAAILVVATLGLVVASLRLP